MKRWQQISIAAVVSSLFFMSKAGSSLAQGDENLPPVLGSVLLKFATIVDGILSVWVNTATGNTLTDPKGEQLVNYLAEFAQNLVLFFAEFFRVLTFG